ncbi:MAG: HAMP domain-containing sensor histidine kinase [Armatimonadia bacterium]
MPEAENRHFRFLADLSHEVRSPLNAIIGFSELLTDGVFGDLTDEQRAVVNDILAAGNHMLRLISDVLDISKIHADKLDLQPEVLCVASVTEQALTVVRAPSREKSITLTNEISTDLAVWADERRVTQILCNILSNAIRCSPAGSEVLVTAQTEGEYVRLSVQDHGCGIAPEDHERIFEDFVALPIPDESTGTGLGLSVSKRLVELMCGTIGVESEKGHGATFSFTLPRRDRPD